MDTASVAELVQTVVELRAENERLRAELEGVQSISKLNAEHAEESANKLDAWRVENGRLRAALEEINDLHVDEAGRCFDIAWLALGSPKRA